MRTINKSRSIKLKPSRRHEADRDKKTRMSKEFTSKRFGLMAEARKHDYDPSEFPLSWEEFEDIPDITEMKWTEYEKVNDQYILKERKRDEKQ